MPQDWRSLFDTSLYSMDTRLVPQVSKNAAEGGEQKGLQIVICIARPCTARPIYAVGPQSVPQVCAECDRMQNMNTVEGKAAPPSRKSTALCA